MQPVSRDLHRPAHVHWTPAVCYASSTSDPARKLSVAASHSSKVTSHGPNRAQRSYARGPVRDPFGAAMATGLLYILGLLRLLLPAIQEGVGESITRPPPPGRLTQADGSKDDASPRLPFEKHLGPNIEFIQLI